MNKEKIDRPLEAQVKHEKCSNETGERNPRLRFCAI